MYFRPIPTIIPINKPFKKCALVYFYKIFILLLLGFTSQKVAGQPSFIIHNQFSTSREIHLQKGQDSTSSMVIQQGGIKTSKTVILPVTLTTQFNSHHPYGYNDASFIPASGLQSQLSFGANIKAGPVKLQLQPELIYAANPTFRLMVVTGIVVASPIQNYMEASLPLV